MEFVINWMKGKTYINSQVSGLGYWRVQGIGMLLGFNVVIGKQETFYIVFSYMTFREVFNWNVKKYKF